MAGDAGPAGTPKGCPSHRPGPSPPRLMTVTLYLMEDVFAAQVAKKLELPMFDRHFERVTHTLRNGLVIVK